MKNFGFVGMGNMAQAIAAGFVAAKKIASENPEHREFGNTGL